MTQLTVVVSVLADDIKGGYSIVDLNIGLPTRPLTFETFTPLVGRLTPVQLEQTHIGVSALRRAFSSRVLTHFVLRRVKPDFLARTDVASEAAWARIHDGGVLVSLVTDAGFRGEGVIGRPVATSVDDALKNALGEAVARIMHLGTVADRDDYTTFESRYDSLGDRLQACAALFNLSEAHRIHHEAPVLNWCETNGPARLAAAHGMEQDALERDLGAAFRARLKARGFESVLEEELGRIEALLAWVAAHVERKTGVASRRDTTRRLLNQHALDWDTAPGVIEPPRMHAKVRRNVVAETGMTMLSTRAMLEAAFLFDLEPAYDVFLTRLYLLPVLAAAGLAGRVGLRRLGGAIDSPVLAGGLVALAESMPVKTRSGPLDELEEDEIAQFQALVRDVLARSGLSAAELAVKGYGYLETGQAVGIDPPEGPRRFFLED